MRRLVLSLLGVGFLPGPTGTYASLVTAGALVAIHGATAGPSSIAVLAALALGTLATLVLGGTVTTGATGPTGTTNSAAGAERDGHKGADPRWVVTDEVAGQALAIAVAGSSARGDGWLAMGLAFLAFRVFDVTKPGPIRAAERLPGGLGILADDLVAGAVGGAIVLVARVTGLLG